MKLIAVILKQNLPTGKRRHICRGARIKLPAAEAERLIALRIAEKCDGSKCYKKKPAPAKPKATRISDR